MGQNIGCQLRLIVRVEMAQDDNDDGDCSERRWNRLNCTELMNTFVEIFFKKIVIEVCEAVL